LRNPFKRKVETRAMQWWGADIANPYYVNASGVNVSSMSVLGLSSAWAAVSLLSDSISTLPVDAVLVEGDQRVPLPLAARPTWLDEPGNGLTSIDVRGQTMVSLLLRGRAHILTPRDDQGAVQGLVVLDPDRVQLQPSGLYAVDGEELTPFELLTIRGMMLPVARDGCSPITYAREAFGSALATQTFGAAFFGNGAWTGTVIEVPGALSEDGQRALKAFVNENHRGASKAHRIGVLIDGAKLSRPITFSPEDSQFLQTREFQVADVARFFRVMPAMIGGKSGDSMTYSTLEGHDTRFVKYSLLHWIVRLETALTALWRSEGGPANGEIKLKVNGLLRGSTKERYDSYAVAIQNRFMTVDEVRALEDLPPLGDNANG
jgi:HK97 family phage portal protein